MTAAPGNNGGLTHLILKSPLAAICVGCAAVGGFLYGDDGSRAPIVTLTFDDGTYSQFANVLPAMNERDMVGTLYLSTGLIDKVSGDGDDFYMADEHIIAFRDFGWELGTHTINHEDITEMKPLELLRNMAEPKTYLANTFGVLATSFSSPYGTYDETSVAAVERYYMNHVNAWSFRGGMNYPGEGFDPYNIHRLDVTADLSAEEVCGTIAGLPNNAWLNVIFHGVIDTEESPDYDMTRWDNPLAKFEEILDCIVERRDAGDLTVNRVTEAVIEMQNTTEDQYMAEAALLETEYAALEVKPVTAPETVLDTPENPVGLPIDLDWEVEG